MIEVRKSGRERRHIGVLLYRGPEEKKKGLETQEEDRSRQDHREKGALTQDGEGYKIKQGGKEDPTTVGKKNFVGGLGKGFKKDDTGKRGNGNGRSHSPRDRQKTEKGRYPPSKKSLPQQVSKNWCGRGEKPEKKTDSLVQQLLQSAGDSKKNGDSAL